MSDEKLVAGDIVMAVSPWQETDDPMTKFTWLPAYLTIKAVVVRVLDNGYVEVEWEKRAYPTHATFQVQSVKSLRKVDGLTVLFDVMAGNHVKKDV